MTALVLATRNDHKLAEFARLLGGSFGVLALPAEVRLPPEDGATYEENALGKARAAAAALGRPAIADDSGIEAAALGGRPGIHSARFAGPQAKDSENLDLLCSRAGAGSGLRYVCVIAYVDPDGGERTFTGTCEGVVAAAPRGADGFGYDPIFELADGRTVAELDAAEKDAISHRGGAVRRLREWLGAGGLR